ncbi:hypothetical protein ACT17_34540 [Mycolicibacterium conceptionense]|uniref:Uncharacterized protein n=1 Tax=Mycolicibacterium conceptionense TaxID=451644 RepID=A0A0J8WKP1_9MYCO|nr:hypothetical protein [Mycolicibacterium conceptionense]KMV13574.1 hypothetical protein ACT17_34540 [Mycolicibacterium conceptionense]
MKFTPANDADARIRQGFHVLDAQPLLIAGRVVDVHRVVIDARFREGIPREWVIELRGTYRDSSEQALHVETFDPREYREPELVVHAVVPVQAQPMFDTIAAQAAQLNDRARGAVA